MPLRRRFLTSVPLLLALMKASTAHAAWTLNMTPGATEVSHLVFNLHMTIFWICVAIGVVVFGVMFWSILNHRKSQGAVASQFHESTVVEILWTIIPFLILIVMAVPATATLVKMYNTKDADLEIKVTGYQWKWHYDYFKQGVSFFSVLSTPQDQIHNKADKDEHYLLEVDEPLVLPIHKKIRFLVTGNDVIHSWWVPALAVKRDAIPGFVNDAWTNIDEPGIYRGQCAELCGKDHGFMPIVVKAVTQPEFDKWIAEKQEKAKAEYELKNKNWTLDELVERGEKVYTTNCAGCHQPDGSGMPPTFPALRISPVVKGPVEEHAKTVIFGRNGTPMQAFGKQLSEVDIAAVVTYERNAWGTAKGSMITPKQVAELKHQ